MVQIGFEQKEIAMDEQMNEAGVVVVARVFGWVQIRI